jgi:arsenate reductase
MKNKLYPEIAATIKGFDISSISEERKKKLQLLVDFIQVKKNANEAIKLNFICTHNSRRSHLSQVWGQTMAFYFDIKNVMCYSGGTEATAVFPMVINTLKNTGFYISSNGAQENPIYDVKYSEIMLESLLFLKHMMMNLIRPNLSLR